MSSDSGRLRAVVLALLLALGGLHLGAFAWRSFRHSLQLDLAAYVTAGQAVAAGLDPYQNWTDRDPPLWDGKAAFLHSRFLYPPLVAWLFAPLGALPYVWAKGLFLGASLLALGASFAILTRPLVGSRRALVALGLLTAYPLLTLLERGQVDAFTLLLVVLAFRPTLEGRKPGLSSGAFLTLAVLLKLNAVFLVGFWLVRRFDRAIVGFLAGGAGLVLLSLMAHGEAPLRGYLLRELPRIARHGEDGPAEMRLPDESLARLRGDAPEGFVRRDGRLYEVDSLGFVANASLARVAVKELRRTPLRARAATFSLLIITVALFLARLCAGPAPPGDPTRELAFLAVALASVLLAGPLTWVMNVIWLLPTAVLLVRSRDDLGSSSSWPSLALALGLLLAWLPDQYALPLLYANRPDAGDLKYVAGEALCLLGSLALLRTSSLQTGGAEDV